MAKPLTSCPGASRLHGVRQNENNVRNIVNFADRFEEFFGGTDIGSNPTEEHGKYLVMKFDFSAVSKDASKVQDSFDEYAALRVDTFAR